jgi:hypothetical protein
MAMKLDVRKGARRIAVLALVVWWVNCVYRFADSCWLPAGPDRFSTFGWCTRLDALELFLGIVAVPVALLIVFVIANVVANWLIDGFTAEK